MITRNWSGLGHEVAKGIEEAERQREYRRISGLMAEERNRRMAVIEAQMGKPVTSEEVSDLVVMYINRLLGPGSLALLRDEEAGKIINALVMMNEELSQLKKIADNLGFGKDRELLEFAGCPVEEAIDRVWMYPEAMKYIPHICKTCKYHSGGEGYLYPAEDRPGSWCDNTRDRKCHWEFNGKGPKEPERGVSEPITEEEWERIQTEIGYWDKFV